MQDIQSITPINSNNNSQPQIQTSQAVLSFHDRAAIVARDILEQIGLDDNKIRMITSMTSTIAMLPPIGPLAQAQNIIKDIEPLMLAVQNNMDPGAYISKVPQEKIEYFLNQVITRLEWVKHGNNEQENYKTTRSSEQETNIQE